MDSIKNSLNILLHRSENRPVRNSPTSSKPHETTSALQVIPEHIGEELQRMLEDAKTTGMGKNVRAKTVDTPRFEQTTSASQTRT